MPEILQNTGVTLWSIRDDYDELQTSVFEALTGTGGKSNIRLIDEAIGNINSKLNGYYFEYSDNRLYICKKSEDENIKRYPVTLDDNNGHIASKVDGSTITIDENGIVRGLPVDDSLSSISTNPIQNKVVKAKIDEIDQKINANETTISSHKNDQNNPHNVTKSQLNLGNVEDKSSETIRSEITKENVTTALGYTPYTPNEVDNKFSTLETNIDWKEAVDTFADIATTYPNPDDGWTVNTKDNNITYRYNGSEWVAISANAIPKATNEVDGLMTKEYAKKLDGLTKYTPDGTTITADEDGTLHGSDTIQVDGITITRDDATKVIALAKTLQDKIGTIDNKVDQNYVVNNLTTTEQGFVLDGRQGKALQDQITSLNGSIEPSIVNVPISILIEPINLIKSGHVVVASYNSDSIQSIQSGDLGIVGTVPSGFIPIRKICTTNNDVAGFGINIQFTFGDSGNITAYNYGKAIDATTVCRFETSYIV